MVRGSCGMADILLDELLRSIKGVLICGWNTGAADEGSIGSVPQKLLE
jgi:hypothetical protein